MPPQQWKDLFQRDAIDGVLVSPGVDGLQKLCEALGGEQCIQKNVTLFLASQKISTTENISENNLYALPAFFGMHLGKF